MWIRGLSELELYWLKVGAIGQVAGAIATFLAVVASLYIALRSHKPRMRIRVGERLIIGGSAYDPDRVLVFSVANTGERPIHVRTVGWRTGWLRWGPSFLKRAYAVQLTGGTVTPVAPPFEVPPGAEVSTYANMANVLEHARDRTKRPLFTRDWPILGRRRTIAWGSVSTADGHTRHVPVEKSFLEAIVKAEKEALRMRSQGN